MARDVGSDGCTLPAGRPATKLVRNEAGVQLLSRPLHRQIFGPRPLFPRPLPEAIDISRAHLRKHGLEGAANTLVAGVDLQMPPLQGGDLTEHFHNIAHDNVAEYLRLAEDFATAVLPPLPEYWQAEAGWTKYEPDGSFHAVDHPPGGCALVFDVETMAPDYQYPILAVAATSSEWYAWVSPYLLGQSDTIRHLVPMPAADVPGERRVVVGHNVSYDRARIGDEYDIHSTGNRFIDTMSLHIARRGLSNPQRPEYSRRRKKAKLQNSEDENNGSNEEAEDAAPVEAASSNTAREVANLVEQTPTHIDLDSPEKPWYDVATTNGLAEVIELHFRRKLDKAPRDLFGQGATRESIRAEFHELMSYCATDVLFTHQLYRYSLPDFRAKCPSPASFAGQLQMASAILPVDASWFRFIESAETKFQELQQQIAKELGELAEKERMRVYEPPDSSGIYSYEKDPWLRQLDWSCIRVRQTAGRAGGEDRPPRWSLDLDPNRPASAILLQVKANRQPLRWQPKRGWALEGEDGQLSPIMSDGQQLQRILGHPSARLTIRPQADPEILQQLLVLAQADVKKLRSLCEEQSMATTGAKSDLFDRLLESAGYQTEEGLSTLKAEQLKERMAAFSLSISGSKAELLARLVASQVAQNGDSAGETEVHLTSHEPTFDAAYHSRDAVALERLQERIHELAKEALDHRDAAQSADDYRRYLDWSAAPVSSSADLPQNDNLCPKWYKQLLKGGKLHLSLRTRIAPLLLRCSWTGHPLVYSAQYGWMYRMATEERNVEHGDHGDHGSRRSHFSNEKDVQLYDDENDQGLIHFKVPHPSGDPQRNTGNPLSKDFAKMIEAKILTTNLASAARMLDDHIACSYWGSSKKRIESQFVVQQQEGRDLGLPILPTDDERAPLGMILPMVVPMGTVTRRAVESTWLTASNSKKSRIGSEIKSRVRAPPGWAIVGADVDSEELWICSIIGDAKFGFHGATALGWQTLEGNKAAETDMHSMTAKTINVSRDRAKVFNYSRLYGAGRRFAQQELLKGDPLLTAAQAKEKATRLYETTKGRSVSRYPFGWSRTSPHGATGRVWAGGSESLVFNALEAVATSDDPRTPALGASITEALSQQRLLNSAEEDVEPTAASKSATQKSKDGKPSVYMTSRVNWVVQSSGVDYLHLLIVGMEHLCRLYQIEARYMISVHDELRYLVKEQDKYRAALALQVAHIWTRSYFAFRLGMDDLPQSCAFFSLIDIDHVLRKETNDPCVTPSSPEPIPPGEALDIYRLLQKTNGSLRVDGGDNLTDLATTVERAYTPADEPPGQVEREQDVDYLQRQALGPSAEESPTWHRPERKRLYV